MYHTSRPTQPPTLLLTRSDVDELLDLDACIQSLDDAFRAEARGATSPAAVVGCHVGGGGFHVKAAGLQLGRPYFAAKINANFPANPARNRLPTIQGVIGLFDAANGSLLALVDSTSVTALRTAAATALAAKYLATTDAKTATIVGCGVQGRSHLRALLRVRALEQAYACDVDRTARKAFVAEMSAELAIRIEEAPDMRSATLASDIVVTCTPATRAVLGIDDVRPGTFVAAVGADNGDKQEIEPGLLAASIVVVDVLEQCATIGDLHHALSAGLMTRDDVFASLAEIVGGGRSLARPEAAITVFDSTGTALEDVAATAILYERAAAAGGGTHINLFA